MHWCNRGDLVRGDDLGGPEVTERLGVSGVARHGNGVRTEEASNLQCGGADTAGRAGNEHALTGAQFGLHHEGVEGREKGFGESASLNIAHVIGNGDEVGRRY